MNSKLQEKINRVHPAVWQGLCYCVSLAFFSLILINRFPNILRSVSMALRTGFGLVIPIAFFLVYFSFRVPGKLGEMAGLTTVMALFAMPLAGLWASGQTQTTILNGLIPMYDAESYYIDALGLINGSKFSIFSARRPLFPGLLVVLLSWTNHNLMASLAILTALVGLACYFAAREIQRTHGAEVAAFVTIILFLFFRAHSGISMSENLGVALGVLGFALLWQGATNKNLFFICSGLLVTTLALNARAGAFFMLPVLILWTGWLFRENRWILGKSVLLATFAIVLGFALNLGITRLIATPSGVPFANFSYTLYGLASGGKSWAYIYDAHPEVLTIPEPQQTKKIYQLAFELIRAKPLQAIQGALYNWKMLFSDSWYNIYTYVGGENWTISLYARWAMYILGIIGIYAWMQDRSDPINSLIIVSAVGVFISVPFLPPTDAYRMRPYAASIIILAALPSLGLSYILKKTKIKFLEQSLEINSPFSLPLIFSSVLVSVTLIGPVLLMAFSRPISLTPVSCSSKNASYALTRFDNGTYINLKKQGLSFLDWMPNYHMSSFKTSSHGLANNDVISWAETLEPPTTLFLTLDFNTNQKILIVYKTDTVPATGKYYQFCGNFETSPSLSSFRIFYANEALPLSP